MWFLVFQILHLCSCFHRCLQGVYSNYATDVVWRSMKPLLESFASSKTVFEQRAEEEGDEWSTIKVKFREA